VELQFRAPLAVSGQALTLYRDREDGASYVYSLLVPADASSLFPCFDQPDLKGRFTLRLRLPRDWRAVSNAPLLEEAPGRARFAQTEPISTYLFAFAAGPFERLSQPDEAVRLWVRRSQLERARAHAGEVLALNRQALAFFRAEFGRPYPFAKYDLVLIPELAYGGMEHAGATFLNEQAIVFPYPPTGPDLLRRAQLLFHEASHQWFGNLVTMRWFDDLWLKEGFANFMAAKAAAAIVPELEPWSAFHALKTSAYRTDVTAGTTPLMAASGVNWVVAQTYTESPQALLEAIELCLELGADINAVNSMGLTALLGAANRGANDIIRLLAANGARLDVVDKEGRSALRWAEGVFLASVGAELKPTTIALLEELGAPHVPPR